MSDVREIVHEYLVAHGYDGLAHTEGWSGCGCGLNDLLTCDEACDLCRPAYRVTWDTCPWRSKEKHDCGASSRDNCFGCYAITKPGEATDETR
jgi:hypothetical protein